MAETLANLALGFSVALSPPILLYAVVGCVVERWSACSRASGRWPASACSFRRHSASTRRAIVMLAGNYYGAMYGGSTASILMRIPGEAASVMTCIEADARRLAEGVRKVGKIETK